MTRIILEHTAGFLVVCIVSVVFLYGARNPADSPGGTDADARGNPSDSIDVSDPLQFALLRETISVFYDQDSARTARMTGAIRDSLRERVAMLEQSAMAGDRGLTAASINRLAGMYLSFVAVYAASMVVTVVVARIGAVVKFLGFQPKRAYTVRFGVAVNALRRAFSFQSVWRVVSLLAEGGARVAGSIVLFSPAYVVAYAFKPTVDTDNLAFMVLLAATTNGVLIALANTYYLILVHEKRKGYVETARVKGLDDIASSGGAWRRTAAVMLLPMRRGEEDVFGHVYANARLQFIPAIKRHALFLVTGLIIIEMALNIQGHLCYELMQSVLFGDMERMAAIGVAIYAIVKSTELLVDVWHEHELTKFRNGAR